MTSPQPCHRGLSRLTTHLVDGPAIGYAADALVMSEASSMRKIVFGAADASVTPLNSRVAE